MIFEVPGDAKAKQRPKFSTFGGHVRAITPKQTVEYEHWVKLCYNNELIKNGCQLDYDKTKPINMQIEVYFAPPTSVSKKKTDAMLQDVIKHTKKPDLDNIIKCITDGLNRIAYDDDKQIVSLSATKKYARNSYVRVTIVNC